MNDDTEEEIVCWSKKESRRPVMVNWWNLNYYYDMIRRGKIEKI